MAHSAPPPYWLGSAIIADEPLTIRTSSAPWGYSLQLSAARPNTLGCCANGGRYWARVDLEVTKGSVGISIFSGEQGPIEERFFHQTDGRALALIPLASNIDLEKSVMIRSAGHPSSLVRIYRAELLCDPDPDPDSGVVAAIELTH